MSSSQSSNPETSSPHSSSSSSSSSSPTKRIVYQVETTGSIWGDVKEAFKRISPRDDLNRINEIPCARGSLLSGIASGVGIGVIRGMSSSVFVASNWAMGTFMLISLGTWCVFPLVMLRGFYPYMPGLVRVLTYAMARAGPYASETLWRNVGGCSRSSKPSPSGS
ncbi:hypothetical protein C8Q80DRAFT_1140492 [Daedaleopsis nitida]|nr:hypothetical protein C8Q80DRAFT_1140492 [Daedaleopsis nitida]